MEIEYIEIEQLKEYKGNCKKHPKEQIQQIADSIYKFGFNDPIAVDENNIIICGHGRLQASEMLELETVPCIRLIGLTEQQKKAYTLVHNKLTLNSDFDMDVLNEELMDIIDFDMSDFGFEIDVPEIEDDGYYGDERERTYDTYNLSAYDQFRVAGFYQLPTLKACHVIPSNLISFNYILTSKRKDVGVHFYIDDYQFERIWNKPEDYIEKLQEYDCCFTPDFSMYLDMPMAMKIWNLYRSRLIGQMCQDAGINVIPTLMWAEAETLDYCFDGIEQGGVVSVSTIGVKQDETSKKIWYDGMDKAMEVIKPSTVLVYGGDIGYKYPDGVQVRYYENKAFESA